MNNELKIKAMALFIFLSMKKENNKRIHRNREFLTGESKKRINEILDAKISIRKV